MAGQKTISVTWTPPPLPPTPPPQVPEIDWHDGYFVSTSQDGEGWSDLDNAIDGSDITYATNSINEEAAYFLPAENPVLVSNRLSVRAQVGGMLSETMDVTITVYPINEGTPIVIANDVEIQPLTDTVFTFTDCIISQVDFRFSELNISPEYLCDIKVGLLTP